MNTITGHLLHDEKGRCAGCYLEGDKRHEHHRRYGRVFIVMRPGQEVIQLFPEVIKGEDQSGIAVRSGTA